MPTISSCSFPCNESDILALNSSGDALLAEFQDLWSDAALIWDKRQNDSSFEGYVSANYEDVYRTLKRFQGRCTTFLEWGSGLGVVAIMASRMGFDAYGIEIEPELVQHACDLAAKHGGNARFVAGSFIPEEFQETEFDGEVFQRTVDNARSGYDELDMELRDFDLIYAYPWPEEHLVFRSIVRRCGGKRAVLICFDQREGILIKRFGTNRGK